MGFWAVTKRSCLLVEHPVLPSHEVQLMLTLNVFIYQVGYFVGVCTLKGEGQVLLQPAYSTLYTKPNAPWPKPFGICPLTVQNQCSEISLAWLTRTIYTKGWWFMCFLFIMVCIRLLAALILGCTTCVYFLYIQPSCGQQEISKG